ncbi:MAG: hypothetical protein ABIT08_06000 [Bacteroidia bacterium]
MKRRKAETTSYGMKNLTQSLVSINAAYNYWYTDDSAQIASAIFDWNDNPSLQVEK